MSSIRGEPEYEENQNNKIMRELLLIASPPTYSW
jgi:hypothetical protein